MSTHPAVHNPAASQPSWHPLMDSLIAQGDQRWAQRRFQARESEPALPWPTGLLTPFLELMTQEGWGIDPALMWCDRRYALERLMYAQKHGGPELHWLSGQLFKHFERRQLGQREIH